ncbi:MAG: hypothetical protein O7G85_15340 [Planctomycetota bacterium]|nr:hypothetical protein [Planctomycetota bacterium]
MKRMLSIVAGATLVVILSGGLIMKASSRPYDGPDWGIHLTAPPYDVLPSSLSLDETTRNLIMLHSGVTAEQLDATKMYTGRTRRDDPTTDVRLIVMPGTNEPGTEARIGVGVNAQGVITTTGFWGTQELELDLTNGWNRFSWQFRIRTLDVDSTLNGSVDARDVHWNELQANSEPDGIIAKLLYEHRLLMNANGYLIGHTYELVKHQGIAPPPEWYESYIASYKRMAEIADGLSSIIGEEAAQAYRERTVIDIAKLQEVAEASRRGEVRNVGKLITKSFRTQSCGSCHGITSHVLETGDLDDALKARMVELGVRGDLFQVGRDIWPVPDQEAQSQEFANAIRAALLVWGSQNDGD